MYLAIARQRFLYDFGHIAQCLGYFANCIVVYCFTKLTYSKGEHCKHCHLAGKGLGRSNAYLRTYMDIRSGISIARYRRPYNICDTVYKCAFFAGYLDCGKGIGSLTGLRYGYNYILIGDIRVTIAILRCIPLL